MDDIFDGIKLKDVKAVGKILQNNPEAIHIKRNNYDTLQFAILWTDSKMNHFEMMQLLLDYGADINSFFTDGNNEYTPLKRALFRSNKALVLFLLQRGANPNQLFGEYFQTTCMHYCAKQSNYILLCLLIEYGGDINIVDGYGNNILHIIFFHYIFYTSPNKIEWLILKGLNVHYKNFDGKTPRDFATGNGSYFIIQESVENAIAKVRIIKQKFPQDILVLLQLFF
jgi:ankyrin repeat protein